MTITNLTAPERETVILTSDADEHWEIWTAQRPIITKLKKNPSAELLEEGFYGSTAWASFKLPAHLLSFRSARTKRTVTAEQREANVARLRRAREAQQKARS